MLRDYDNYSFLPYEIINREILILFSLFGKENKYLNDIQNEWFEKKDLDSFRDFIEISFEKNEIQEDKIVNRDSLSCLLRLMAMCDCFYDYQSMYDATFKFFVDSKIQTMDQLQVYDFAFKEFAISLLKGFEEAFNKIRILKKYEVIIDEIGSALRQLKENVQFHIMIDEFYRLNDLISDLLDILEENDDGNSEFESDNEVILYNFAIYYSTKFYFSLLFRELIIQQEEKLTKKVIMHEKPLIMEEELRVNETKLVSDLPEDIFYRTLKN
ncbi:hypothetical protein SCORR_v1c08630 [Spiroplasma corruscae]|uniref:Uncharacterized protein n=1 Tax=Spiroplasma corruscae TaxID=216934 RepID=A0A222EQ08_9MOLU|nr:hypothetical protein [Spiroplasma corruscae]ASP28635.1 hypothetical protein SCORR_v1c08630 [Spiroplasma corruscae]